VIQVLGLELLCDTCSTCNANGLSFRSPFGNQNSSELLHIGLMASAHLHALPGRWPFVLPPGLESCLIARWACRGDRGEIGDDERELTLGINLPFA
jgi:hypothetical protein